MRWRHVYILLLAVLIAWPCRATNYYVAASGSTPTPPWTNWAWAHTNLIEAVAQARDGDTVYVTNNATYYLTNHVSISYAVTVRSWAPDGGLDPTNTLINGNYPATTNRCFSLNNYGAWLKGLTITNGCDFTAGYGGGGVQLKKGHLTNCVITGNRYTGITDGGDSGGGGLYCYVGSGSLWNCTISHNTSYTSGGGIKVYYYGPWLIANSMIAENVCSNGGGGVSIYSFLSSPCELRDCRIVSNNVANGSGNIYGGGIQITHGADLMRCMISDNSVGGATLGKYGAGVSMNFGTLRNCVIANNYNAVGGNSLGGGIYFSANTNLSLIQNCTIYSNAAANGGGLYLNACTNAFVENSIVWANSSLSGTSSNYAKFGAAVYSFTNCCVAPDPGESYRTNCVFSNPLFAGLAVGNVRLQPGSPCVNTGVNREWMNGTMDMDGHMRINRSSGMVDIGAYEFMPQGTILIMR